MCLATHKLRNLYTTSIWPSSYHYSSLSNHLRLTLSLFRVPFCYYQFICVSLHYQCPAALFSENAIIFTILSFFFPDMVLEQVKAKAIRWLEDNRGLVIVVFCLPASFVSFPLHIGFKTLYHSALRLVHSIPYLARPQVGSDKFPSTQSKKDSRPGQGMGQIASKG